MNKLYTYPYDTTYEPAMPMVNIQIGRAMATPLLNLTALVDSGADATIIPMSYLRQVGARRGRKKWMRGVVGGRIGVNLFPISLSLGSLTQNYLEVVGDAQNEEIIVGRDILNQLTVTLNGLGHVVEIVESDV